MIKINNIIISGNNKFLSINVKEWKNASLDKAMSGFKLELYSYLGYKENIGIKNIGELIDEGYGSILILIIHFL